MSDSSGSVAPEPSSLARAMANEVGIERDMEQLSKFVREKLFGFMVHDLKNQREDVLSDTGVPCQTFIKYFVSPMHSVNNVHVLDVPEEDLRQYLKFLWKKGLSDKGKGNIRKNLSQEKSAVYAAVENCFKRLMLEYLAAGVPFPAYETLQNRKELGRRFFLFYDLFFQAGRHNKEAWKAATFDKNGENNKRFGNGLLEAHIQTTIQENYFRWIYQGLTDRKIIQSDEDAFDFETEYDAEDRLSSEDTCTLKLPKNCEIVYNDEEKKFVIIQEEEDPEGFKAAKEDQLEIIKAAVRESQNKHQDVLDLMKREVRRMRSNPDKLDDEALKVYHSKNKKRLKQLVDKENGVGGNKKKRKRYNKSRCSDEKISFLLEMKQAIDDEEKSGVRQSWETAYKKVMNEFAKNDDDSEEETANEISASVLWANEMGSIEIEEL